VRKRLFINVSKSLELGAGGMQLKTSRRTKVSSPKGIRWGFVFVIFFMFGVSLLLIVSAGSRFPGVAWGNLIDWKGDGDISLDGFMAVDLSDTEEGAGFMRGAAYASQFQDRKKRSDYLCRKN